MAETVTVDKSYFDTLLRRADFYTTSLSHGRSDAASVTISRVEYDSLLQNSREFETLKCALYAGGVTAETLNVLISGANSGQRKDSGNEMNGWNQAWADQTTHNQKPSNQSTMSASYTDMAWRQPTPAPSFNLAPGSGPFVNGIRTEQLAATNLQVATSTRPVSYDISAPSCDDDTCLEEEDALLDDELDLTAPLPSSNVSTGRRTLFFSGLPERVTYRDLLSVVKGGKLLSVSLRRNYATVTFWEGASDYLAWTKRNDVYFQSKRINIKWADRQYNLNSHVSNKVINGVTRNILIRNARAAGLTEERIREDMEHIHNLVIIDVSFREGDAYVSTNSIHNALFARTCMMSRTAYKSCKISYFRDECDVPLPAIAARTRNSQAQVAAIKRTNLSNRFDLLHVNGSDTSSDGENQMPAGGATEDDSSPDTTPLHRGARFDFAEVECP